MFSENQEATAQENGQTGHSVFDQKMSLASEDDAYKKISFQTPSSEQKVDTDDKGQAPDASQQQAGEEKKDSLFSDSLFKENAGEENKDDALIAELAAKGYKVEKAETVDENLEIENKIKALDQSIATASQFLRLPDAQIVKEKIKNDKADLYMNTGRQHLINSEEFEIEVDAEMEQYEAPAVLKMYANSIRTTVQQNVVDKSTNEKNSIIKGEELKIEQQNTQKKQQLEGAFDSIHKDGLLGIKFEAEQIKQAYQDVVSGKFATEIKNNPKLLAELVLITRHKQTLEEKAGGPTYGQGVKDAVDTLDSKRQTGTSPMTRAMQSASTSDKGSFNGSAWSSVIADAEIDAGKKVI